MAFEAYAAVMASMLTLFVPSQCGPLPKGYASAWLAIAPSSAPHWCSWAEGLNWAGMGPTAQAALVVNAVTLAAWLLASLALLYRELWLGRNLDEDRGFGYENLPAVLRSYPSLQQRLRGLNTAALGVGYTLGGLSAANFGLSAFRLCYGNSYGGYRTARRPACAAAAASPRGRPPNLPQAALRRGWVPLPSRRPSAW